MIDNYYLIKYFKFLMRRFWFEKEMIRLPEMGLLRPVLLRFTIFELQTSNGCQWIIWRMFGDSYKNNSLYWQFELNTRVQVSYLLF